MILPLMAVAMIFVGCNDDDDANGGGGGASPATVEGTWNVTSEITVTEIDTLGTTQEFELSAQSCTPTPTTVFDADGTVEADQFFIELDAEGNEECNIMETQSGTYEQVEGDTYLVQLGDDDEEEVQLVLSNGNNTLDVIFENQGFDAQYIIRHSRQ